MAASPPLLPGTNAEQVAADMMAGTTNAQVPGGPPSPLGGGIDQFDAYLYGLLPDIPNTLGTLDYNIERSFLNPQTFDTLPLGMQEAILQQGITSPYAPWNSNNISFNTTPTELSNLAQIPATDTVNFKSGTITDAQGHIIAGPGAQPPPPGPQTPDQALATSLNPGASTSSGIDVSTFGDVSPMLIQALFPGIPADQINKQMVDQALNQLHQQVSGLFGHNTGPIVM